MSERNTTVFSAIAVIGMILGGMGVGIGSFTYLSVLDIPQQEQTGISKTWYKESFTPNNTNPIDTAIP